MPKQHLDFPSWWTVVEISVTWTSHKGNPQSFAPALHFSLLGSPGTAYHSLPFPLATAHKQEAKHHVGVLAFTAGHVELLPSRHPSILPAVLLTLHECKHWARLACSSTLLFLCAACKLQHWYVERWDFTFASICLLKSWEFKYFKVSLI